ncbi:cytochrome P450 family 1 subfamily C polypeptide 1 [Xenopus tropicalis]|uniref:Cytochrome P450 family 1 subfamily C polypeptide 1 n=1 Tax=Xenopus tropicalis TaxID=8364 RepID=E9LJ47_XENTR|nr:cytochrome P450 family 1 subfamily C polypeptide 1 [Xenopus tropicalis]ADR10205.1 cytochrome P450 family 1 subfamily C polypeptide 1 [Xenopus tropicalis]|eukprot:NP_001191176.1 cytochrome P450 family 1 subfamily C polypeptide 1 [Xenopus tropicalis]
MTPMDTAEPPAEWKDSVQPALVFSFLILICLEVCLWLRNNGQRRSPPGPFPWPVVGNAMQLGQLPHLTFCKMSQKYGNVFQIRLGTQDIVVLNGDSTIREALVKHSKEFAGRPNFSSFQLISGGKSIAFGGYSTLWKAQKKIAHSTLRAFSTVNSKTQKLFEKHVVAEAQDLIDVFLRLTSEEEYFDPTRECTVAAANVICALCFGKRYSHDDEEFKALIGRNDKFGQTVGAGSLVDIMPWLLTFPNPVRSLYQSFKDLNWEFYGFVKEKVSHHRQTYNPEIARDMSDAFISHIDNAEGIEAGDGLSKDYVESIVNDILGAGQDTTATALTWILLLLIKYPDIQQKLQEEIDLVVGPNRLPTADDKVQLPYVQAFIYEALRFSSFVPVTIPHSTTSDVVIDGFYIPKDTVVFVNQWSVNHDESKWKNPDVFDPSRFLDEEGQLDRDAAFGVMIFSVGKRRCIGDQLSMLQIFLCTAIFLHQCTLHGNPKEIPTMDCISGLSLKPLPYGMSVRARVGRTTMKEPV